MIAVGYLGSLIGDESRHANLFGGVVEGLLFPKITSVGGEGTATTPPNRLACRLSISNQTAKVPTAIINGTYVAADTGFLKHRKILQRPVLAFLAPKIHL